MKFGSTLLTQYFSFNPPDKNEREKEKIIASSNNFAINSQAALQFYQSDPTVKHYYKRLYHVGWPNSKTMSLSDKSNRDKTKTGGATQENACHVVELMCACAAYDFFYANADQLNNEEAVYLYRSVEEKDGVFSFNGKTFINDEADLLSNKLGIFFSFAHIVLSLNGAATKNELGTKAFIKFLERKGTPDYSGLTDDQTKDIDEYMKKFGYDINTKKEFVPGWIYQINTSIGSGRFIFKDTAFEENVKRLSDIDPGDLFMDEKRKWGKHSYDILANIIADDSNCKPNTEVQHLSTMKEKFLAHIYRGIAKAQHFESN